MKRKDMLALVFGSSLVIGSSAVASSCPSGSGRCGAGKCGANMQEKSNKMEVVQDNEALVDDFDTKSINKKEDQKQNVKTPQMKCGAGKCGSSMK